MNPFSGTLNRLGFLLWSLICIAIVIGFGLSIDATKSGHEGAYWLPYRILFITVFTVISFLVYLRRIEDTGLSKWFAILWIFPFASGVFWFALFFIPSKAFGTKHTVGKKKAS